jgi:hypothetical protein
MDSQKPQVRNEEQPPKPVRYTTRPLNQWNLNRRGDHQLDSATVACLHDSEITDRDRLAFALRELRRLGYEAEALPADWTKPVDWTKPRVICGVVDCDSDAFGHPARRASIGALRASPDATASHKTTSEDF